MVNGKVKVLCLVGGGKFGCIPARFLSYVSCAEKGRDLIGVDFMSGTSIGGILAAAYAAGNSFKAVSDMFNERAKDCFIKRWQSKISLLACPTYKGENLRNVIKEMIGDETLGGVKAVYPKLSTIIPALDLTHDEYLVFQNIKKNDHWDVPLIDIAQMTSAAQTYFPCVNFNGNCVIDAGVIDVTSMFTCITAIHGKGGIPFEDMDVLMIGIGDDSNAANCNPITPKAYQSYTNVEMLLKVVLPYLTFGNKMVTTYWGRNMGFNSFTYWNPIKISGDMDDTSDIPQLVEECDKYRYDFMKVWTKWLYE